MRQLFWSWVLLLGLGCVPLVVLPLSAADRAEAQKIDKLIEQLGSSNFDEREQATRDLQDMGPVALEALRQAAQSEDAEIKRRAADLVAKLEKAAETEKFLKPTSLHLVYNNTPLREVLEDLRKKTGGNILLQDPQLGERRITLDTGETTFWEAFEQVCRKADVVELLPGQTNPANPAPQQQPVPGANPVVPAGPVIRPAIRVASPLVNQIVLVDGKYQALPTDHAGAVRLRALLPGTQVPGVTQSAGEYLVALQASPEPRLQWQNLVGLTIDRAVDDRDQTLTLEETATLPPPGVVAPGLVVRVHGAGLPGLSLVPVRLKKGSRDSKMLKELKGTLSAQIRTAPEPLITVDNLLKAVGTTLKGKEGGSIRVLEAAREDSGQFKLRFELEQPPDIQPSMQIVPLPAAPVAPGAGAGVAVNLMGGYRGLTVQDDKGHTLPLTGIQMQAQAGATGLLFTYTMMARPEKDQGEPTKLVFSGTRLVAVDIPFTLKDVPLQ